MQDRRYHTAARVGAYSILILGGDRSKTTAEIVPGAVRILLGLILLLCTGAVGLVACSSAVQPSVVG